MTKHTPGPWKHSWQPRLSVIHGPNGEHIADTGAWRDDEHPEMRANGDLLAAAPDLLEALEDALKCFQISTDYEMSAAKATKFRCEMRKKARAAIAKAKGESQ